MNKGTVKFFNETKGFGFIKEEGKLKNFQYYFSKCFLDIYLINKNKTYYVNMIKTRPTELNGKLVIDDCLKEIHENFN